MTWYHITLTKPQTCADCGKRIIAGDTAWFEWVYQVMYGSVRCNVCHDKIK